MRYLPILAFTFFLYSCDKDPIVPDHSANKKTVGASANDLLSSSEFEKLVIEIQSMPGFAPEQASLDNLKAMLESRLNKPNGIVIKNTSVSTSGVSSYDLDRIKQIEDDNRTEFTEGTTIAAYFLFLDAEYAGNSGGTVTLGIAWRNTSMVIFERSIHDYTGSIGQPTQEALETTVIEHEFGHILGLVDIGSDMQTDHKDDAHGAHCDNSDCLMYYQAETGDIVAVLLGGVVPQFDANCISDLQANGGQ